MAAGVLIKDQTLNLALEAQAKAHVIPMTKTQLTAGLIRAALAVADRESTSVFAVIEELNRRAAKSKNTTRGAA